MRTHIYTEVGRYRGRIAMWDVVNEAIDGGRHRNTIWQQWIGDDWIDLAFQFAHEADPEALLFYNDYGAEGKNLKSNTIYDMVSSMVERGVPINGVGLQMHLNVGATAPGGSLQPVDLAANIQRLGELGLEVHITEMDVGYQGETTDAILQQQAADYRRVMSVCLEEKACKAFVVWGVSGRYSWKRNDNTPNVEPLLFNQDFEPQPAYDALRDLLARQAGLAPILSDAQVQAMMGGPQTETHAVDIPAPVKSDPNQLAPDPVPGLIYYAPFNVSITLDGETDDWANVPRVTVDQALYAPDGDTTAYEFAAAADERNLYFLAVVHDAHIIQGLHPTSDWWQEDGVEFYLNTTGDLKATAYTPGIVQIGIMAANITGPDEPIIGGSSSADAHAQVVAQETDDGYLIEASVPLDNGAIWQIVPEQGGVLGFQSHLNGASVQDRDTKLIWSAADTQDQSYSQSEPLRPVDLLGCDAISCMRLCRGAPVCAPFPSFSAYNKLMIHETPIPDARAALPDLYALALTLVRDTQAGALDSWPAFGARVHAFFSESTMDQVDTVLHGWRRMASFHEGVTLVHVVSAYGSLLICPEYQQAAPEQQRLMEWIVLFHDVGKEVIDGQRDPIHAFRSAAQTAPALGFSTTDAFAAEIDAWAAFTAAAVLPNGTPGELKQDNAKLPQILTGIDRLFGPDSPTALVVKAILLHMSVNVLSEWPQAAPLDDSEIQRYVNAPLLPLLKVMMLVDNDAWAFFNPPTKAQHRAETLAVFERIEKLRA